MRKVAHKRGNMAKCNVSQVTLFSCLPAPLFSGSPVPWFPRVPMFPGSLPLFPGTLFPILKIPQQFAFNHYRCLQINVPRTVFSTKFCYVNSTLTRVKRKLGRVKRKLGRVKRKLGRVKRDVCQRLKLKEHNLCSLYLTVLHSFIGFLFDFPDTFYTFSYITFNFTLT